MSFERTIDRFGMATATDGASAQCPPDCLMKSNKRSSSCTAIFQLRTVGLQYMHVDEVVSDLLDANICIICPVCDVTHLIKCTRPSPA